MSAEDLMKSFQAFILEHPSTKTNVHEAWELYARYIARIAFVNGAALTDGVTNLLSALQYGDSVDQNTVQWFMKRFLQDTNPLGKVEVGSVIYGIPAEQLVIAIAFCRAMVTAVEAKYKSIPE